MDSPQACQTLTSPRTRSTIPLVGVQSTDYRNGGRALSTPTSARPEARGIWVVRTDLTSPEKIHEAIKYATENNFNILIPQVRGRGDAFYTSHFEPRSEALDRQPADFDPLKMYVEEGHKAGLQIIAWLNTHYSWSSPEHPKSPEHVVNKHPEWLMRTREGEFTFEFGGETEGAYTCPSNPLVKEHVKNCFLDVVANYDVDGINFDFVRYPNPDYCFCDTCLSSFKAQMDAKLTAEKIAELAAKDDKFAYVDAFKDEYDQFRRDQITDLVSQIYHGTKAIKPKMLVTADVFPEFNDAYSRRFQDWKTWMKMGIMDILMPMAYAQDTETWVQHVADELTVRNDRLVYAGLGQWRISAESCIEKIRKGRELGADGFVIFAYGALVKDGGEYIRQLKEAVFQEPAALPETPWM